MNTAGRLALCGAGLVLAFAGAFVVARAVVPAGAVEAWQRDSGSHVTEDDEPAVHDEPTEHGGEASGHDPAPDGGPAPAGIAAASDPTYAIGTRVRLTADHMPGMRGAEATISGAFATTTYSVSYTPITGGDPVVDHRWVVHEELRDPGRAPLADGTEVVLDADHMPGMRGANAIVFSSTTETVYTVDLEVGGMQITRHKWVVESEIEPVE